MAKFVFVCKFCTKSHGTKALAHACCKEKRAAEATAKAGAPIAK